MRRLPPHLAAAGYSPARYVPLSPAPELDHGQRLTDIQAIQRLFSNGENGGYWPADPAYLYEDSAWTLPASLNGVVGLGLDISRSLPKCVMQDGVNGQYLSTPDSAANSITGDIDIRVKVMLYDWTPTTYVALVNKWTAGNYSYAFLIDTVSSGKLRFQRSSDGTVSTAAVSTVSVAIEDGSVAWVRATYATATGATNFYKSTDGVLWAAVGTQATITSGAIFDASTPLNVGWDAVTGRAIKGRLYRTQIYNGINGTLAVDLDPNSYNGGSTFTSQTGEVWTLNSNRIVPDGNHAIQATTANKPYLRRTPVSNKFWLDSNIYNGALTATFASSLGSACTIATVGAEGVTIAENQTVGTTYNLTPPYGYNGDVLIINRALTAVEKALVTRVLGRNVPTLGSELVANGEFDTDLSGWTLIGTDANNTITWEAGSAKMVGNGATALRFTQVHQASGFFIQSISVTITSGIAPKVSLSVSAEKALVGGVNTHVIANTISYSLVSRQIPSNPTNALIHSVSVKVIL